MLKSNENPLKRDLLCKCIAIDDVLYRFFYIYIYTVFFLRYNKKEIDKEIVKLRTLKTLVEENIFFE